MEEPCSNKYDRYATTLVKFQEIEKDWNKKDNKEILEKIEEENENNSANDINNKNINENKEAEKRLSTIRKKTNRMLSNILIYDNNFNDNRLKKKNLNEIMSQFSYHDLDDSNDIYKEPKNINYEKLRKEVQDKKRSPRKTERRKRRKKF